MRNADAAMYQSKLRAKNNRALSVNIMGEVVTNRIRIRIRIRIRAELHRPLA